MPQVHPSLTDADFIAANKLAEQKNMPLKDWASAVLVAEIHKVKTEVKA